MAAIKPIPVPSPAATSTPDRDITASQAAHAAKLRKDQSRSRSVARATAAAAAKPASSAKPIEPDARLTEQTAWRASANAPEVVLEVIDAAVKRGSATPRTIMAKSDPGEVAAWFAATGLTRKQLAAAAGVSASLIGTVQSARGDRWSTETWSAKRRMIEAYIRTAAENPVAKDRPADRKEGVPPGKEWVKVGGRTILVDSGAISEH
jgi:hypothetical protein